MNADEFLRKRAEAHAAECAGLDDDILIQAVFGKPKPLPPITHGLFQEGWMFKRQAC